VTPAAWRFGGTPERSTLVGWSCIPYITQAPPHVYGYGYWFRYRYVVAHDPALLHCECDRSVGVMDGGSSDCAPIRCRVSPAMQSKREVLG
jgi:hypothetical protein